MYENVMFVFSVPCMLHTFALGFMFKLLCFSTNVKSKNLLS